MFLGFVAVIVAAILLLIIGFVMSIQQKTIKYMLSTIAMIDLSLFAIIVGVMVLWLFVIRNDTPTLGLLADMVIALAYSACVICALLHHTRVAVAHKLPPGYVLWVYITAAVLLIPALIGGFEVGAMLGHRWIDDMPDGSGFAMMGMAMHYSIFTLIVMTGIIIYSVIVSRRLSKT